MPGYEVPDDPDGLLPWSRAEERRVVCRNYFAVTADASGRPHVMPTWGVWSTERSVFWFSGSARSRKARNRAHNPKMAVAVDDSVEVVSVEGTGGLVRREDRDRTAEAFAAKYESTPDGRTAMAAFVKANAIFQMTPDRRSGSSKRLKTSPVAPPSGCGASPRSPLPPRPSLLEMNSVACHRSREAMPRRDSAQMALVTASAPT